MALLLAVADVAVTPDKTIHVTQTKRVEECPSAILTSGEIRAVIGSDYTPDSILRCQRTLGHEGSHLKIVPNGGGIIPRTTNVTWDNV